VNIKIPRTRFSPIDVSRMLCKGLRGNHIPLAGTLKSKCQKIRRRHEAVAEGRGCDIMEQSVEEEPLMVVR
jgi:hypothetical protein